MIQFLIFNNIFYRDENSEDENTKDENCEVSEELQNDNSGDTNDKEVSKFHPKSTACSMIDKIKGRKLFN